LPTLSAFCAPVKGNVPYGQPGGGSDTTATSAVEATQTAHLYFPPTSDLSLIAASGHGSSAPADAPVPESSTVVSLSVLLFLGLGGLAVAARKRSVAARCYKREAGG